MVAIFPALDHLHRVHVPGRDLADRGRVRVLRNVVVDLAERLVALVVTLFRYDGADPLLGLDVEQVDVPVGLLGLRVVAALDQDPARAVHARDPNEPRSCFSGQPDAGPRRLQL